MIYSIIYICVLTLFIFLGIRKTKYSMAFALMFLSFMLISFSATMCIIKFSNYRSILQSEMMLYFILDKIRMSYYDIKYLVNFSIAGYLVGLFALSMVRSAKTGCFFKYRKTAIVIFSISILIYLFLNSPDFGEQLFIWRHTDNLFFRGFFKKTEFFIVNYNLILILFMCLLPYLVLVTEHKKTKLLFKKNNLNIIFLCLAVTEIIFVVLLCTTPLLSFVNSFSIYDFDQISIEYTQRYSVYFTLFMVVSTSFICIMFIKFKIFDIYFFGHRVSVKNMSIRLSDLRHVFHTFKNYSMIITALENKAVNNYGTDEGLDNLKKIKATAVELAEQAGNFIDIYNGTLNRMEKVNTVECVNAALLRLNTADDIRTEISVLTENVYVNANKNSFTEMCYNIVSNSMDAIKNSGNENGEIKVTVMEEENYICLSFLDNGCGMNKKMKREMFKPFTSSKKSFEHWGIGMSQVYSVVKSLYGYINVESKLNKFTEIQLVFIKYL